MENAWNESERDVSARRTFAVDHLQSALEFFVRTGAREKAETAKLLETLSAAAQSDPQNKRPSGWDLLTKREREVAHWVAEGLTDKEVAAKLYVSPRTVDHHLRSVFRKLEVRHRTALANYLNRQDA